MTCLVIGGVYGNDKETTYYRVNFHDSSGENIDILRNHNYNVKIVSISGSGYDTPEEAFKSNAINMETEVLEWSDSGMGEIHESDGYRLAISPSSIVEFNKLGGYWLNVELDTNYPDGWKLVKVTNSSGIVMDHTTSDSWIKLRVDNSTPIDNEWQYNNKIIGIYTEEIPADFVGTERTGHVHIQFAKTTVKIKVIQSTSDVEVLEITDKYGTRLSEILFITGYKDASLNNIEPKQMSVHWAPDNKEVDVANLPPSVFDGFRGDIMAIEKISNGKGLYSHEVKLDAQDGVYDEPFERRTEQTFSIEGTTLKKKINIRHINYGISVELQSTPYNLNGRYGENTYIGDHSFIVKSNLPWVIKDIKNDYVLNVTGNPELDNQIRSRNNLKTGYSIGSTDYTETKVTFATRYDYWESENIEVTIGAINGEVDDITFTINTTTNSEYYPTPHGGWAGSNIYWDGTKMTFDDPDDSNKNENYQGLYFQWGSLWGIDSSGQHNSTWTTAKKLYAPGSNTTGAGAWSSWTQIGNNDITATPPTGKINRDRGYLYELDVTNGSATGLGDICKYITQQAIENDGNPPHDKMWRLPTSKEFENIGANKYFGGFSLQTSSNVEGKSAINSGYTKTENVKLISYPASGYRAISNGLLNAVGSIGYYWSSSPSSANSYAFALYETFINSSYSNNRAIGFSIRCVVDQEAMDREAANKNNSK